VRDRGRCRDGDEGRARSEGGESKEISFYRSSLLSFSSAPPSLPSKPPASLFLLDMDDLTSLKTTLVSEASNFVSLFSSKLEQSESDLETAAILESFWEVLDGEPGEDSESREFRMVSGRCVHDVSRLVF